MPDKLNDILKLVGDIAANVTQPDTDLEATKALEDALKRLGDFKDALAAISRATGQNVKDARQTLRNAINFQQGTQLRDFFDNVAQSLIAAQARLDDSSREYSRNATKLGLPASRFAIPNVRAELRFGFSNLSSRGLNVFLFSSQEQRQEHSESSVAFDLIATSPSPKDAKLPGASALALVVGRERQRVLGKVLANIEKHASTVDQLSVPEAHELALVLEYQAEPDMKPNPETTPRRFFIVWPGKPVGKKVDREDWSILVVAVLEGDTLVRDVFEKKNSIRKVGNILLIPPINDLDQLEKKGLTDLVLNLGDALMNACMIIDHNTNTPIE